MQLQEFAAEHEPAVPRAGARSGRAPAALDRAGVLLVQADPRAAGASGRLLERALLEAGLAPGRFDHSSLGPRLWAKLRLKPRLVVAVGRAAAETLLGRPVRLSLERGRVTGFGDGQRLLLTESPAAVLALSDAMARGREYRRLVSDLMHAVPYGQRRR